MTKPGIEVRLSMFGKHVVEFTNISLLFLQKYVVNHNSCHQDQYS